MRQLSKRTQYSLRALYALARKYGAGPVLITQLAQEEAIPKTFWSRSCFLSKTWAWLRAKRARAGAIAWRSRLTRSHFASVIRMMEGPLAPLPCASETRFRKCDECVDVETCGTRIVMREVRDAIAEILERTTLATVSRKVDLASKRSAALRPSFTGL